MATEFVQIFAEMGYVSGILLTLGIILSIVEIFIPGVGFCGISGAVCTIAGIIFRCVEGISLYQLLVLILLIAGLLALAVFLLIILIKSGLMADVGVFSTGTALPRDYKNREAKKLIGKTGKTTTDLMLAGRVKIRGKVYDAISQDDFIAKNKYIKVIKIENNRLVVRRFWE